MAIERVTNEGIRIGDLYTHGSTDECGYCAAYYQVIGLRGKTLVELRRIKSEPFVKEDCVDEGKILLRPVPGQFDEEAEAITLRVWYRMEDGRYCLIERGVTSKAFAYLHAYDEVKEGVQVSPTGIYAIWTKEELRRQGKLPKEGGQEENRK